MPCALTAVHDDHLMLVTTLVESPLNEISWGLMRGPPESASSTGTPAVGDGLGDGDGDGDVVGKVFGCASAWWYQASASLITCGQFLTFE